MRRVGLLVAAVCIAALVCVVRLQSDNASESDESARDLRGRQAESRYLQVQPNHWRKLALKQ